MEDESRGPLVTGPPYPVLPSFLFRFFVWGEPTTLFLSQFHPDLYRFIIACPVFIVYAVLTRFIHVWTVVSYLLRFTSCFLPFLLF